MAQPTQLTPTEQDALVKQIGLAMLRVAPEGWEQLTVDYRAVGRYSEATGRVVYTDGGTEPWTMPPDLQGLFARLRGGMYREGRGTWFNARYRLDHPSSYNLEYDREEPSWDVPPPPQAYPDDMRLFPRTDDNVPAWLHRRLASAPPPAPGGPGGPPPPPRFRVARIFDGPNQAVNRPPVSPDEARDILDYLDGAPLAGPARGYDVDRMDPDGRQSVPVAFHTDGTWIWPAAVNYYLREHNVPPEPDLVTHIARQHYEVPLLDESVGASAAAFLASGPGPGPGPGGPPPRRPGPPGPPGPPPGPPPGAPPTRAMAPAPAGPPSPPPPPVTKIVQPAAPVVPPADPAGSAPPAALPSQGPPAQTIDTLRARLSNIGVPETAFRIGPPTGRAWTMEETDEGWRVGWYDRAFVAPAMFEDVADASAFLLGKLMMDADRGQTPGPVHVVPASHGMLGGSGMSGGSGKDAALSSDEPMSPSQELDAPPPAAAAVAPPPPPPAEAGFSQPFDAGGYGSAPDGGGFGLGGAGGYGSAADYSPQEAEPESGRHGRHGLPDEDDDRPVNGQSPYGRSDDFGPPDDGHGQSDGFGRPDGGYQDPDDLPRRGAPASDGGYGRPDERVGATRAAFDQPGGDGSFGGQPDPRGSELERTAFAPPNSLFTDSPPSGFERPDLGGPPSPQSGFDRPEMSPPRGFDRPDVGGSPGFSRPESPAGGFERPSVSRPESPAGGFERPNVSRLESPAGGFERPDLSRPESPAGGFERPDLGRPGGGEPGRPDSPGHAGDRTTVAPPARPAAAPASGDWPISPLPGEPPLTLFRGKRLIELEPGTEIDRFGEDDGNLVYACGTPFRERSLVPEWVERPYHVYQVRQPVQVLTGAAIPWFDQPGGGTAYLLPDAIGELVATGRLVEVNGRERPPN